MSEALDKTDRVWDVVVALGIEKEKKRGEFVIQETIVNRTANLTSS